MGIRMMVKKAFRPRGSNSPLLQPGSPFVASGESLARTYRAMGWAEDAPAEEPPLTFKRRDLTAESPASPAVKTVAAKKTTRTYTRRAAK